MAKGRKTSEQMIASFKGDPLGEAKWIVDRVKGLQKRVRETLALSSSEDVTAMVAAGLNAAYKAESAEVMLGGCGAQPGAPSDDELQDLADELDTIPVDESPESEQEPESEEGGFE
jgi:hypothetical protein